MKLRDYQDKAVERLKLVANSLLELQGNKTIVFEAPTGSGKTVMMAEFIKDFVENREDDKQFAFIWAAPRQLHNQSKKKLENYFFDSKAIRCSSFEDLSDKQIGENEILFLNWESINKADNIYIRDNESDFNLSNIIQNTVDQGRIIIMVIDESHFAAKTETSMELIQMLQPKIAIEVSATPHITGAEKVTVYREKVIEEGMIKKRIAINPGFKNIIRQQNVDKIGISSSAADGTNDFVIRTALAKREELAEAFREIGSNVNPLMLIQLPDRRQGLEDVKEEVIQILRAKHSITVENGKLAIYLSEDKANLENITRNDSEVEVMIFKQAIALGWDCPRASILVLFRDWKSITFSIQTVGRILRMPELKHYAADELNTGIVYTNLSDISIQEDIAGSYLTINFAKRKPLYQPIALQSVHSKRFREATRLSPQFIHDFLAAAKEYELQNRITTNVSEIMANLISDGIVTNPDRSFEHLDGQKGIFEEHSGETVQIVQTEREVQLKFDLFVRDSLSPFAPEKRSIDRVKDAIYRFLLYEFPDMFEYGGVKGQAVVLSPKNRQHFIDVLNRAKEIYRSKIEKDKKELAVDEQWEVPASINCNNSYSRREVSLCIHEPFYESNTASGPEKDFASYLDSQRNDIEWWFKNGQRDGTFFAVPYVENNQNEPFYVDWIVKYKDGRVGLFDTKAGMTAKLAKPKAEGLAKYIKEENTKGKNIFGGIVILKDSSWRYNDSAVYDYNEKDLSGWKFL
ncbi:MAG: DEAD/DEAH box helicase family protein [Nitrospirae bacterium]|nr:DEAD/DEAH box helicase family protein [Nitrospirota bacterium]